MDCLSLTIRKIQVAVAILVLVFPICGTMNLIERVRAMKDAESETRTQTHTIVEALLNK